MSDGVHHKFPHELQTLAQCHTVLFGWPNKSSFRWHLYHKLNKLCVCAVRARVSVEISFTESLWSEFFSVGELNHYTNVSHISTHFSISPSRSLSLSLSFSFNTFRNSPHKHAKHECCSGFGKSLPYLCCKMCSLEHKKRWQTNRKWEKKDLAILIDCVAVFFRFFRSSRYIYVWTWA